MNPEELRQIGRWPVRSLIGQGGFSWVFEVEDEKLSVRRALKLLKPEAAKGEQYRRFLREARILAQQDDPHLVRILELDRDPETGLDYYVMELLAGRDLKDTLKEAGRPLPWKQAAQVILDALRGLARLHVLQPTIIHRDVKPANIWITNQGRGKLLDLGIAGVERGSGDAVTTTELTMQHSFVGTVAYASPEQLNVESLTASSDVFSMGLCLYEAMEGRHPYATLGTDLTTGSYQAILTFYARLTGELVLRFEHTPGPLQEVLRKALRVRPEQRLRTAGEMVEALETALGSGDAELRPPRPERSKGWRRPLGIGAALAVLVTAGAAVWWRGPASVPTAPEEQIEAPSAPDTTASPQAEAQPPPPGAEESSAAPPPEEVAAVAPNRPPTLQLDPRGRIELGLGESRSLSARASDAEGDPITIDWTVQGPDGSRTHTGPKLAFKPSREGDYEIEVVASDAKEARSEPVTLRASVGPLRNQPPTLRLDRKSLDITLGESPQVTATASDPEGAGVTVEWTLDGPGGRTTRTGKTLAFRPEEAGEYRIEAVARDPEGTSSRPVTLAARVAPSAPPSARPSAPPSAPPSAAPGASPWETLLEEYRQAISAGDLPALQAVWRMPAQQQDLFRRMFTLYPRLDVTTHLLDGQQQGDDSATIRFTQRIAGVTADGKFEPLAEGPMVATLTWRPNDRAWQITSLRSQ